MRQQPANSIVWKNGPKQGKLDTYEYLSNFLGILYGVLDPEIFILSGSVALKIPGFIEEVEKRTKERTTGICFGKNDFGCFFDSLFKKVCV